MSSTSSSLKLFKPFQLGDIELKHRVVLAPLTRMKAMPGVLLSFQRSSAPGTLVISEATAVAPQGAGWRNGPGIWSDEQASAWKEVVDSIHANGSYAFMQLFAMGRAAQPEVLAADSPDLSNPYTLVAPSPIPMSSAPEVIPRELSITEIHEYVELFAQAAVNAIKKAGFDGVELHLANGYLLDQFLSDRSNQRTDEYGGSIDGRLKLPLEVLDRVVEEVGAERVAIRLSPWSPFQDVLMEDPVPTFTHLVNTVKKRHPTLSYLHIIEPRISGNDVVSDPSYSAHSNEFIRKLWASRPLISAGGYNRETAIQRAEAGGELIAFGRWFISNPDLPTRLQHGAFLTPYNRSTFYKPGDSEDAAVEYIDYPITKLTAVRPRDIAHPGRAEI